jgi:hypothetical protein
MPLNSGAGSSGLGRALATEPHDRRVGQVGAEALLGAEAAAQRLERAERDLLLRSAAAADQMTVSRDVRAMPAGHAIVEVGMGHVAEVLERFEISVDGRRIDLGMARADLPRDLFRRRVMTRALERVEHQSALHRHPLSLRADLVRHTHGPRMA